MSSSSNHASSETEGDQDGPTERQAAILALVKAHGFATIDDLARRFEVSTQTIRRDITRLDELKLLRRFHGGAGLHEAAAWPGRGHKLEPQATSAKGRIGDAVAAVIPDGTSVFLDVSTTVETVTLALSSHKQLQIVTPSVTAAALLARTPVASVIVTGGLIRGPDGSLVGDAAVAAISRFKLDWAVIGCSGFEDDGTAMDVDLLQVEVKQHMLNRSRRALLVAESTTLQRRAVVNLAPLAAFDILVTDQELPAHLAEVARASGCEVKIA
ncbi:MAG: DeoR/GlpR transcriptional regulator [Hyphomicrobiaceae bacterium]|nr:DeoR/GlpR transcriptional regulator [Hyphomicrobiaceae bacterium]